MQLDTNNYKIHHTRIKMNKIKGYLKSTLRKREAHIAYDNMINSEYMFSYNIFKTTSQEVVFCFQ